MVLLRDVVEILHLSHDDLHFTWDIYIIYGSFVGAAVVYGDLLGNTTGFHGLFKKAQS